MSPKRVLSASGIVVFTALFGIVGSVRAEGITEKAGKGISKGLVKGIEQELEADKVTKGAKQVTKGMLDGAADAAPMVTSQLVKQADVNKKTMGKVARTVTSQAVAGAIAPVASELKEAIGPKGDGPGADAMVAMTERLTAAIVRGVKSETSFQNFQFRMPLWPFILAFIGGCLATFVCALGILLLYIAFQRRRPAATPLPADVAAPASAFSAS